MQIEKVKNVMLAMQRFSWEQGVAAQAMWEIGEDSLALLMADEAIHRQTEDGRLGVTHPSMDAVDPGANGLPVWWAYRTTGKKIYKEAAEKMAAYFLSAPRSRAGLIYHNTDAHRTMIDGVYHMAPFLTAMGHADLALEQIRLFRKVHLDPRTHLYSQIWDDDQNGFSKKEFWGCGVGWMLGALSLTASQLEEREKSAKEELSAYLREGVESFLPWVTEKGLTHDILDDSSTFEETAAVAMTAYAIYRGIQAGILSGRYKETADRFYTIIESFVDEDGYLRQGCDAPTFDRPGVSAEDQAFALMCWAAKRDLEEGAAFRFAGRRLFVSQSGSC